MAKGPAEVDIKTLAVPEMGNRVFFIEKAVPGFGVRVTSAGHFAYVLDYRTAEGRQRRLTIGDAGRWVDGVWRRGSWTLSAARDQARAYRREVDQGQDPMAARHEARAAKTVDELCHLFETEFLASRRATTQEDYRGLMRLYVRPKFGRLKVDAVRHVDIASAHREIARRAPYRANRFLAVMSVLMKLAIKEGMRPDDPVPGVEKAPEHRRERFLSPAEVGRLVDALVAHPERASADAITLLLLTGARRMEVLSAEWSQFGEAGVWTKPAASTKQKRLHVIPLSAPARDLLATIRARVDLTCPYLFPSGQTDGHLVEVKRCWLAVCKMAGLAREVPLLTRDGKPVLDEHGQPRAVWESTVRLHDLRHSYASILANAGLSLQVVGRLLGHTQSRTTARYSHLYDDTLRAATEHVGAVVTGASRKDLTK